MSSRQQQPWLLLVMLVTTALARPTAAATTTCQLRIKGHGDRPGIAQASMSCNGASITAAAEPELLKHLQNTPGVQWSRNHCDLSAAAARCMLRLCGTSMVQFTNVTITGVVAPTLAATICFTNRSSIVVSGALFSGNKASFMWAGGNSTLAVTSTTSTNNLVGFGEDVAPIQVAGVVAGGNSTVTIEDSTFINNTKLDGDGSVLLAVGFARVRVARSMFSFNRVMCPSCNGGAVQVVGNASGKLGCTLQVCGIMA